jgi:glycosyltransferase involved in cell wall biosynthesis
MTPLTPEGSTSPLRVLVVGLSWPMETFVERLLVGLARAGVHLTVSCAPRPPSSWLEQTGFAWVPGGARRPNLAMVRRQLAQDGPLDAARTLLAAATHGSVTDLPARAGAPHVIYAPWLNALMVEPGFFDLGVPVVTSCRGALVTIAPWDPARPDYRARLAEVFDGAALVHCVSEAIFDEAAALGLDRAKGRVIRPAVDPDTFEPTMRAIRHGPARVVAVGSLIWRKDHEHALVGLRRAIDAGADLHLEIVGEGPDLGHLRYTVDDLDLVDRVLFRGRLAPDAVAAALRDADIFLHTSTAEGISNAVLEAMAAGLAVVTTDAGGMREAVRHDVDGLVVPVRGTTEVGAALCSLATDPDRRRRLGSSARRRVTEHFHLDDQVRRFQALLADAADQGRVP